MAKPYTEEIVAVRKFDSWSKAPNGSSEGRDFYTVIESVQTWLPGTQYAGYRYTITERYISNHPGRRGQYIGSSSTFLSAPEK